MASSRAPGQKLAKSIETENGSLAGVNGTEALRYRGAQLAILGFMDPLVQWLPTIPHSVTMATRLAGPSDSCPSTLACWQMHACRHDAL